ncbi:hypothetical protein [Dickeya zeae]|uniref:hypothetical protein n=1 Tax=Dickeya zeae TaxID=204042 RepID=UPI001440127F|nr:hypothetical protein [Dickeya zeae]QIZ48783.1 hypothetical protein DWV07_18810 [Dickeya zeae]
MNSIPTLGSVSIADPDSKLNWRSIENSSGQPQSDDGIAATSEVKAERQAVTISTEAFNKYYTEIQAGDRASKPLVITAEEMHANFMALLAEKFKKMDEASNVLHAISEQIDQTYQSFMDKFVEDNPDVKEASFGFSVSQYGRLVVTKTQGLNQAQVTQLEQALNASHELVEQANKLANAQIAVFDAEDFDLGVSFNRDNYAQTIDIGAEIMTRNLARVAPHDDSGMEIHQRSWDNNWRQQLLARGVPNR